MSQPPTKPKSPANAPIINEEADRILGRILLRYFLAMFLLLSISTFLLAWVNIPQSRFFRMRHFLDMLSILVIMIPFFMGTNRVFAARLRIGRELIAERRWPEAIAALDPFAGPTQRFLDTTGEAHFLLSQAYAASGDASRAAATRAFVIKHRRGIWAAKLQDPQSPRPNAASLRRKEQEKQVRPTNLPKKRRRF